MLLRFSFAVKGRAKVVFFILMAAWKFKHGIVILKVAWHKVTNWIVSALNLGVIFNTEVMKTL